MRQFKINIKTILITLTLCLWCLTSFTQTKGGEIINENAKTIGETYAVVVGISDYQDDDIPDLEYADQDALAFAGFLQSPGGGSLDKDHLKVMLNEEATLGNFVSALSWLVEVAQEDDRVMIYFSGHGDVENTINQPGFLLCWDAPSKVYMAGGTLGLFYFQSYVSTLSLQNKAKVIVIADACRSGKLSGSAVDGSQITNANLLNQFANESKILSCQPSEYSIEGEQWGGGRGAFSYHMVNGLYGLADRNQDGEITLMELRLYLEDHVTVEVEPYNQLPVTSGDGREVLAYVDQETLAEVESSKRGNVRMYSAIALRGIEEEILDTSDQEIRAMYEAFNLAIEDKRFLKPEEDCAEYYYALLLEEPSLQQLHSGLTRNYAAALQDDAQQELNITLKSGLTVDILAGSKATQLYEEYPRNLARASELLGESHYLYNEIKARQYYFESTLEEFNKDKRTKLYKALKWHSKMPHAFNALIFTYPKSSEDSALYVAEKTMELVPNWVLPYIQLSRFYRFHQEDIELSYQWLERGYEIDSTSAVLWYEMGRNLRKDKRYQEAEYWLLKVLETKGEEICFPCAHILLAEVYREMEKYKEAEIQALAALDEDHEGFCTPCGYNGLAFIYEKMGNTEQRKQYILKAIEDDSTFAGAYNDLGRLKKRRRLSDCRETLFKRSRSGFLSNQNSIQSC